MEENNEVKNGKNIADDITKKEKPPLCQRLKKMQFCWEFL